MIHRCSAWILCQVDDIIVIRISCRNEPVANFVIILLSRQYIGDYCVLQTWKGMFRIIVIKWNEIDPTGNIQLFLLLYGVLIERIGSLDRGGSCKTEPGGYKMSHIDIRFTVRIEIHATEQVHDTPMRDTWGLSSTSASIELRETPTEETDRRDSSSAAVVIMYNRREARQKTQIAIELETQKRLPFEMPIMLLTGTSDRSITKGQGLISC